MHMSNEQESKNVRMYRRAMWLVYFIVAIGLLVGFIATELGVFVMDNYLIFMICLSSFLTLLAFKLAKDLLR